MKKLLLSTAFILAAAPALAAPHTACLQPGQVLEYKPLPGDRLLVIDNFKHRYAITFINSCKHISAYSEIAFRSAAMTGLSCAIPGDTVLIGDPGGPPDRCIVKSIEHAPPAPPR